MAAEVIASRLTVPVETKGAKSAKSELDSLQKSIDKTGKSTDKTKKKTSQANQETKKLTTSSKILGAAVGTVLVGGFIALNRLIGESTKLFAVQEQAEFKLAAVVRATGEAAGFTADQIKSQASALQEVTTFGDEAILSGQAILATFKSIRGEAFERTTEVALDLATVMGTDLKSSMLQLGKALEEPATGLTALRRVGVSFTEQQKDQIKQLQDAGKAAEAQAIILDVLEGQVGGTARALAKSSSGEMQQFENSWGDIKESIGGLVTGIKVDLLPIMRETIGVIREFISGLQESRRQAQVIKLEDTLGLTNVNFQLKQTRERLEDATVSLAAMKKANLGFDKIEGQQARIAQLRTKEAEMLDLQSKKLAEVSFARANGLKTQEEVAAGLAKNTDLTNKNTAANDGNAKSAEDIAKAYKAAIAVLAQSGNFGSQLEALRIQTEEQKKVVREAGLSTVSIDKFVAQKRLNTLREFLTKSIEGENLSFTDRQAALSQAYTQALDVDNLSYEERLEAQRVFSEQSKMLEQDRMASIAAGFQSFANVGQDFLAIGRNIAQVRQNQITDEINAMEAAGATQAEIDAKRKKLARDAAISNKRFSRAAVILDTSVAITKALASTFPPASYALAALSAAKGATQLAVVESTPIPAAQFGGTFTVPAGNEADQGLLRVSSGEEVSVTPVRETNTGGGSFPKTIVVSIGGQEFKAFLAESVDSLINSGRVQSRRRNFVKDSA